MSLVLETEPLKWSSLWRPIEYVFHHYDVDFSSVADNGSGYAQVQHDSHDYSGQEGEYVYMNGTVYKGMYKIRAVDDSTHLTLETSFTVDESGGIGLIGIVDTMYLVAGYPTSHSFHSSNPERTVCYVRARASSVDGKVHIRVEEYLQSVFKIMPPTQGFDYWMSTPFQLMDDGDGLMDTFQKYAANAAIKTSSLQGYTVAGQLLTPDGFIDYGNACYITSEIVNNAIYNNFVCGSDGWTGVGIGTMTLRPPFIVR